MKLAIFGSQDKLEEAISGLKLSPVEIHAPSELNVEDFCRKNKYKLSRYGIDWGSIDVPGAVVAINKFGKEYNKRAPLLRQESMLNVVDAVLLLGDDKGNQYVEKDVSWKKKNGAKIELLKWPCQTKVTKPEPQPNSDLPPDEDIPF